MKEIFQPRFQRELIEDRRSDGYWIEALDINKDFRPDIVAYGLNEGEVNWYQNPSWKKTRIAKFIGPVGMHYADIGNNGWNDIVICYQYGQTMVNCDPNGGKIVWLENPRNKPDREWSARYVGKATAMHRLRVGYFTQKEKLEILALPIVGKPNDIHSNTPILLFTQPDDVYGASQWHKTVIKTVDDTKFHVVHGVCIKKFSQQTDFNLDSALIASEEGITWLYFNPNNKKWDTKLIGTGELYQVSKTSFKGSGNVDVGKVGNDTCAYIATIEPFHGNTVAVYYKKDDNSKCSLNANWERIVLDVYGDPNPIGEGPGHHVICADFDNDGDDEFLVALRGSMPWQGVFYYKCLDPKKGIFAKWRVSSDSAARIAVADFNHNGKLDFATVGYSVKGYYCAENPSVVVFKNDFA